MQEVSGSIPLTSTKAFGQGAVPGHVVQGSVEK
jgi:hypothetical protein